MNKQYNIPILFQFYNNPETTILVFNEIKKIKPDSLYLCQDGFRPAYPNEENECLVVRHLVTKNINWPCKVYTQFRDYNLGPGKGTAEAIKWFFNQVEYGIVLEHDCLPHPDFFRYCEILLDKYKENPQIKLINGSNYQAGKKFGNASYYFCTSGQLWGWASWKRTFVNYTDEIDRINYEALVMNIRKTFKTTREQLFWIDSYNWIKNKDTITWDIQLMYLIFNEKGVIIQPNVNLVSNIGFGEKALNCKNECSNLSNAKTESILPLKHPRKIRLFDKANTNYLDNYLVDDTYRKISMFITIKRKIRRHIPIILYDAIKHLFK